MIDFTESHLVWKMINFKPTTACDLWGLSQGVHNLGRFQCYYCGSQCTEEYQHNDPAPTPNVRPLATAKSPSSPYYCLGCKLWRKPKMTVTFLHGKHALVGFKDNQKPQDWSWWIEEKDAWAIRPQDYDVLREKLLDPPSRFVLAVADESNNIHQAILNDVVKVEDTTEFWFTYNNRPYAYTPYEFKEGGNGATVGVGFGTSLLLDLIEQQKLVEGN